MIRLRDIALLLATGTFAGCSPVKDFGNSPDASIDASDTAGPTLVRSNPANMGTKFSVIQPITLTFDEQLDPASISATTIKLGVDEQIIDYYYLDYTFPKTTGPHSSPRTPVRGTVEYDDASRTITFTPARPLNYGQRHTLSVGVKDVYGNAFDQTLNFLPFVNGVTRETQLGLSPNTVNNYVLFPPDMNGFLDKRVQMIPYADGQWFTADDRASIHVQLTYDPSGRLTDESYMNGGTDGILNTPDDTIALLWKYIYDPMGQITERAQYYSPGPDSVFNTGDDLIQYLFTYSYTAGTPSGYVWYNHPGSDTLWRTPDDRCVAFWDYTFDASGNKTRETFKACGGDLLPRTADDTFSEVRDYTYNANNEVIKVGLRNGPGTDAMWLTADDSHSMVTRIDRDASGLPIATFGYGAAGTDLVWNTADDVATVHTRSTYSMDTKQLLETVQYNDDGVDNMFGTTDDVALQATKFRFDGLGNRIDQRVYRAGDDAMFNTADDRVLTDLDYDTSH